MVVVTVFGGLSSLKVGSQWWILFFNADYVKGCGCDNL